MSSGRSADRVTSLDVARLAGVSQSAVSRVFTPGASASSKTAAKVRAAADRLGYRPNMLARAMTTGRSRIIALVVAYLENQFYPAALERLSRELQARGYHILVFMAQDATEPSDDVLQQLLDFQVDGIITASVTLSNDLAATCHAADIPIVMFNRGQDDTRLGEVTSDNVVGGQRAAEFFIAAGHKRIAHIAGWQGSSTGRNRAHGFRMAMRRAGLAPFAILDGDYAPEQAASVTRELFSGRSKPDAIFVGSDHMAFAVMDELRFNLGLDVPGDVSVIGYDDVPAAAWPSYALTTIRQPVDAMVDATVDMLIGQIENNRRPTRILVDAPLVVRRSARIPKGHAA